MSNLLLNRISRNLWISGWVSFDIKRTRLCCLLLALFICAISAEQSQAQSNPDFTNVNDILQGKRTMLQVTDLVVASVGQAPANTGTDQTLIYMYPVTTQNSQQTNSPNPPSTWGTLSEGGGGSVKTFSGRMWNEPVATIVAAFSGGDLAIQNPTAAMGPMGQGLPNGAVADFNQDGYDDLALSYTDGSIFIATASDVNWFNPPIDEALRQGPTAKLDVLSDMAAGDFNGDGRMEIAGLAILPTGGLKLVIYTVDPQSLTITPASSLVLNTATAGTPITHVAIARGRFNSSNYDQLAVTFATNSGPSIVEIIDFSQNPLTPTEASSMTASTVTIPTGYLQIKTGKFALPGNPYDQIVWHESSTNGGGRFFQVISADATNLALTAHSGVTYDQFPCASGIEIGNFDNQQPDSLSPGTNEHNPNAQIAFLYCNANNTAFTMNIYNVDSQSFDVQTNPQSINNIPNPSGAFNLGMSFIAADLQGRSMVLGEPTKVMINNERLAIATAAPPMHIDYVSPDGVSPPQVINFSYIPDGYNTSFQLTQASKTGASTTGKFSWSAGANESTSAAYQIGDPDQATGDRFSAAFKAAQDFTKSTENSNGSFSSSNYDISTATRLSDVLFYDDSRLNIWVYPVLGQTACPAGNTCPPDQQVPLTLQFSGPDQIETGKTTADTAPWYQPPWEVGNIFSYPATKDQLAQVYPDLANTQLSSDQTFYTDDSRTSIQANWASGADQGQTTSTTNNFSFDATFSVVTSVGVGPIAQGKFTGSVGVSGSVGWSTLQTNTASMESTDGIGIQANALFADPFQYKYAVTPVILGGSPPSGVGDAFAPPKADIQAFGPLKTAFVVDPLAAGAGSWWTGDTSPYKRAPDVAVNHASRWILTKPGVGGTLPSNCGNYGSGASDVDCADIAPPTLEDPWNSQYLAMKGFFITGAGNPGSGPQLGFATAGDKLDLGVRVYNYSLASMPEGSKVHVQFYGMVWNTSANLPSNNFLISEESTDPIPPFSDAPGAPLNWKVVHISTAFDTTPYSGQSLAFWVVVWIQDASGNLVREMPGHGLAYIPGSLTALPEVPIERAPDTQGNLASYSNNVGFYHSIFYVQPRPSSELGAEPEPPSNPADVRLARVYSDKKRIKPGEMTVITSLLKARPEGARGLKVYFYDGDPDAGGELISKQTASVKAGSTTQVRIPYYAPSDGVHRIFAIVNKGQSYQTERHTSAIIVGRAHPDRYNSDGDDPPNDRGRHGNKDWEF